jgi:hypothetical protein
VEVVRPSDRENPDARPIALSISVPCAEVLVILHDLVVHRNILLLRHEEARLHRIKIFHTTRDVVLFPRPFMRPCLFQLHERPRWWRELGYRPTFDGGVVNEEPPIVEVMMVDELVCEAAEEVLALSRKVEGGSLRGQQRSTAWFPCRTGATRRCAPRTSCRSRCRSPLASCCSASGARVPGSSHAHSRR